MGEGLEQSDLAGGERPGLEPTNADTAKRVTIQQHGHGDGAPVAQGRGDRLVHFGVGLDIRYMHDRTVQDRAGGDERPTRPQGKETLDGLQALRGGVRLGTAMEQLAVVP